MALFSKKKEDKVEGVEGNTPDIVEEAKGVLSEEEKSALRDKIRGKKVDLGSVEQQQALEEYKLNEIEEELKREQGKKGSVSEFFYKLTQNTSLLNIVVYYLMFTLANSIYLVVVTENLVLSLIVSAVMSVLLVKSFVLGNAGMKRYMGNLYQVSAYTSTLVHHLKSSNSMKGAYEECEVSIGGDVKYDIIRTLRELDDSAELDTKSFERYKLKNLDVFHKILGILFKEGSTEVGKMFESILNSIMQDVEKKNELIERKKTKAQTLYLMAGIGFFVPILLSQTMGMNYDLFLTNVFSQYFLVIYHSILLFTLSRINKSVNNVSLD